MTPTIILTNDVMAKIALADSRKSDSEAVKVMSAILEAMPMGEPMKASKITDEASFLKWVADGKIPQLYRTDYHAYTVQYINALLKKLMSAGYIRRDERATGRFIEVMTSAKTSKVIECKEVTFVRVI